MSDHEEEALLTGEDIETNNPDQIIEGEYEEVILDDVIKKKPKKPKKQKKIVAEELVDGVDQPPINPDLIDENEINEEHTSYFFKVKKI